MYYIRIYFIKLLGHRHFLKPQGGLNGETSMDWPPTDLTTPLNQKCRNTMAAGLKYLPTYLPTFLRAYVIYIHIYIHRYMYTGFKAHSCMNHLHFVNRQFCEEAQEISGSCRRSLLGVTSWADPFALAGFFMPQAQSQRGRFVQQTLRLPVRK